MALVRRDGRAVTIRLDAVDAIEEQHDTYPVTAVYLRGGAVFYVDAHYEHVLRAFLGPIEGGTNDSS